MAYKTEIVITRHKLWREVMPTYQEKIEEKANEVITLISNGGLVNDDLDKVISLCIEIKELTAKNECLVELWQDFVTKTDSKDGL